MPATTVGEGGAGCRYLIASASTGGYWVLTADGVVHPFGDASNYGSPATGRATAGLTTIVAPSSGSPAASVTTTTTTTSVIAGVSLSDTTTSSIVQSLTPSSGTAGGGDSISITGTGFSGALAVYFGTNASSDFAIDSPTSITAVAPVGAGTVDVRS